MAALDRQRPRRRTAAGGPVVEALAEELRLKLATQRDDEPGDAADDEPAPEAAPPVDLAERRAEVHARAQEAIDSMREGETEGDGPDAEPVA